MKTVPVILYFIFFLLFTNAAIFSETFTYKQSFEESNPVVFWTSNAAYNIHFFGTSSERSTEGAKSLKLDVTVNGSGDKECYYYWKLPLKVNLHGKLDFSADLWMDSTAAKFVKIGYHYGFPPTTIERTPASTDIAQIRTWYTQSARLSDDVIYHAEYFSKNKIYGSTYEDFGREIQFIQLSIKARGTRRITFYIDNVQLTGEVLTPAEYVSNYTSRWNNFQVKLSSIKQQKHQQYNSLPEIPDITNLTISERGISYYNQLNQLKNDLISLFSIIDNSQYFDTAVMDSLNHKLNVYPSIKLLLDLEIANSASALNVFTFPSTRHNRLDESNFPSGLNTFQNISVRMCRNEYEPFSLLLHAKTKIDQIRVRWANFTGQNGIIDSAAMDVSIAKVWYQAGITETEINNKLLTQELLIKNDNLIKVNKITGTNYLLVKKADGSQYYTDISTPSAVFPSNVSITDSKVLLPFSIEANSNKQLWFTLKMPDNISPGIYQTTIQISDQNTVYKTFPLYVEVLPFKLDASRLIYGIYYNGYIDNYTNKPFNFTNKTELQYRTEIKDIKEHGILYPTTYQVFGNLDGDLRVRNEIGLPTDKLFAAGFKTSNPQSPAELSALKSQVAQWKNKIGLYGYKDLYVYGIDEASGELLRSQKAAWRAVQEAGANLFVAGYDDLILEMKELIDAGIVFGEHDPIQPYLYHSIGKYILSYSNPQAGYENPEIYRRNYGIALWKSGYDGAMDYAYQKNYGSMWNDFDGTKYRDQNFTYPITNGVISTIQWEGFREAVDDVKYLSTLLNKVDYLKSAGADVASVEQWIASIDPTSDLDAIRDEIINKILFLNTWHVSEISPPEIEKISFIDSTLLKITFNRCLNPASVSPEQFSIQPALQIYGLKLSTDLKTVFIKTSAHKSYIKYSISVNDVIGIYLTPMLTTSYQYSYNTLKTSVKIFLQGPFQNGVMSSLPGNMIPLTQPFNNAPWNYSGTENIPSPLPDIVDWVLLELRNESGSLVYRRAALLNRNGNITDVDGSDYLNLYNVTPGNYYISVKHRNHLGIVSASAWNISEIPEIIDLTKRVNVSSKSPMIKFTDASYGLVSGDCDMNGKVEILDLRSVRIKLDNSGYFSGDVDLDGNITQSDYDLIINSLFKHSTLPDN